MRRRYQCIKPEYRSHFFRPPPPSLIRDGGRGCWSSSNEKTRLGASFKITSKGGPTFHCLDVWAVWSPVVSGYCYLSFPGRAYYSLLKHGLAPFPTPSTKAEGHFAMLMRERYYEASVHLEELPTAGYPIEPVWLTNWLGWDRVFSSIRFQAHPEF